MKKLIFVIIGLMVLFGCTTTTNETPECPRCSNTTSNITLEKTSYVCWDNSTVDSSALCTSQPERIIERTRDVYINTTKYVCSNGVVVNNVTTCPTPNALSINQTFSGTSADVTDQFYLGSGLIIINGEYEGTSNFIVKLLDDDGNMDSLVFNEIGDYTGRKAVRVTKGGYYRLGIEGIVGWSGVGGDWTLTIEK